MTKDEAQAAIAEVAAEQDAPLHRLNDEATWTTHRSGLTGSVVSLSTPARRYDRFSVSLPGRHQQRNAALAVRTAELTFLADAEDDSADAAVRDGLADVRDRTGFHGRVEVLQDEPLVVVDVAHNPPGVRAALDAVAPVVHEQDGTLHVCLNAVEGKGLPEIAEMLAKRDAQVTPFPMDTKRALPPDEITATLRAHRVSVHAPQSLVDTLSTFRRTAALEDGLLCVGTHKVMEVLPAEFRGSQ